MKEEFIGRWRVRGLNNKSPEVKKDEYFVIEDAGADEVKFHFENPFGDGCWNHHVKNGRLVNGRIRAKVMDDGKCKPAPKTDTLLIHSNGRDAESNRRQLRLEVFKAPPLDQPVARGVEEAGIFEAEDDG